MRRRSAAVTAALALLLALTGCDSSRRGGDAPPSPSACVEQYLEALKEPLPDTPPDDPGELLLYDRLTYRISGEDYLRFAVLRYTDAGQVPEQYRFEVQPELVGTDPLTGVFFSAMWEVDCLPPGALDAVMGDLGLGVPVTDSGSGTGSG